MKKIGVLFQIGNFDIWNKMKIITNNINTEFILMTHFNTELVSEEEIEKILNYYKSININCIVTKFINRGMDICGFFKQIEYIILNDIKIDYVLKLHTKSNDKWRSHLVDPICSTNQIVNKCIEYLNMEDVGQICCKRWYIKMDHFNTPTILQEMKVNGIENNYIDEIDWVSKQNMLYDLNYFDPDFYLNYPYNKIPIIESLKNDKEKLKSYALFHWLQIGYNKNRLIHNRKLIINKKNKHISFCAGSIFWINAKILINFFKKNINFIEYYNKFEPGYFKNDKPTLTHSWERLFSIIVENNQKKTIVL